MRPADADIDSGMLERNTAATIATPTSPPPNRLDPIAADSGMPSSNAPSTSAVAPPAETWVWLMGLLRRCPPRWSMSQSPMKNVAAPAHSPPMTEPEPPDSNASSVSSNDTALMSTPAPKAMTSPSSRVDTRA